MDVLVQRLKIVHMERIPNRAHSSPCLHTNFFFLSDEMFERQLLFLSMAKNVCQRYRAFNQCVVPHSPFTKHTHAQWAHHYFYLHFLRHLNIMHEIFRFWNVPLFLRTYPTHRETQLDQRCRQRDTRTAQTGNGRSWLILWTMPLLQTNTAMTLSLSLSLRFYFIKCDFLDDLIQLNVKPMHMRHNSQTIATTAIIKFKTRKKKRKRKNEISNQ